MYLKRVQIRNFRNFAELDVQLSRDTVVVGENRVGKSNLIYALRLVLDNSLPDSSRQLRFTDIWDGCELSTEPEVSIHLDFADFDGDLNLVALLTDYRLPSCHTIARLSYVFRKKADIQGSAQSESDYEYVIYGGDDETRSVKGEVRRRLCLDLLHALRDAESDLGAWKSSPLRPLLADAIGQVSKEELREVADRVYTATKELGSLPPIEQLTSSLQKQIADFAGEGQDLHAQLGFAPTDPIRLFRAIGLYIDDGKRGIGEASLGSANLALLTLKLAEFEWRHTKNDRNYTLLCIEEPEAHLHPHLQRTIFQRLLGERGDNSRGLFLTTHSPNIASVAPLSSIVMLRTAHAHGSVGYSLAELPLDPKDREDLQRYLDSSRAEILFSSGVIFVEGDAELTLLPIFAASCGYDLDRLGITVCSVGGVNFGPYVRLACSLDIPFTVVTDWDPLDGSKTPLGQERAMDLLNDIYQLRYMTQFSTPGTLEIDEPWLRNTAATEGIFLNHDTLELEIARSPLLLSPLLDILEAEKFGSRRQSRIQQWRVAPATIDGEHLLSMVADVGKGRLAGRLADKAIGLKPPHYIDLAIQFVVSAVRNG